MIESNINTEELDKIRDLFKNYVPKHKKSPISHDQIQIMTYDNVWAIGSGKSTPIREVINDIQTKSNRRTISNKKKLPVAYFSAGNISGRKLNANVTQHSGLIICDIDIADNPNTDFIALKKELCNDKYTYACFNSPSGGIKVIVNTNIRTLLHHEAFFQSVKSHYLNKYKLTKIDPSGCNIARACYLPFDDKCYFNPNAFIYWLTDEQIDEVITTIRIENQSTNTSISSIQIDNISYDEHFDNLCKLLKKRTETGIYANIFNDFRYYNIERGVMDVSVPFLELIILKHSYPYKLNWETKLDEYYFQSNPQEHINVKTIDCPEGLEVCNIGFDKDYVVKEHFRAKTLGSMTMKLIFNNPFCHPDILLKLVTRINDYFCEDPNPLTNPKPNEVEVRRIVLDNYSKFLEGTLDFNRVIRKKGKSNENYRKFVFRSKQYLSIDRSITHLEAVRAFHDVNREIVLEKLNEAVCVLQDGNRITQKRIAEYIGMSVRNLRRYDIDKYDEIISRYNDTIKSMRKRGNTPKTK